MSGVLAVALRLAYKISRPQGLNLCVVCTPIALGRLFSLLFSFYIVDMFFPLYTPTLKYS